MEEEQRGKGEHSIFSGFLIFIVVQTPQHNLGKLLIQVCGKCFPAGLICIIGSILNLLLHFGGRALAKEDCWQLSISFLTSSESG